MGDQETRVLQYSPKLWKPRWRWLEGQVYPKSRGFTLSQFDKGVSFIIILSILVLSLELVVEPETARYVSYTSFFFLAVFSIEFLIRSYLRGWGYIRFWGGFDLLVILGDLSVCLTLVYGALVFESTTLLGLPVETLMPILRTMRLLRLLRAIKLFFQFSKGQNFFSKLWSKFWLPISAFIKAVFVTIAATVFFMFVLSVFFGAKIGDSFLSIFKLVKNGLFPSSSGDAAVDLPLVVDTIENVAALVVVLAVTTIVTQIFVAILSQAKGPSEGELLATRRGYTVINVNSDVRSGVVEELVYLFQDILNGEVTVLVHQSTEFSREAMRDYPGQVVLGSLYDPASWRSAAAMSARTIISVDDFHLNEGELAALLRSLGSAENGGRIEFVQMSSTLPYNRAILSDPWNSSLVTIPFSTLEYAIGKSAWDTSSILFAGYQSILSFLGQGAASGSLRQSNPTDVDINGALESLKNTLPSGSDAPSVEQVEESFLVWFSDDANEKSEISALAAVHQSLKSDPEHPIFTRRLVFFVRSFELLDWQNLFDEVPNNPVDIFALELITVLAIYHELLFPGVLAAWIADDVRISQQEDCVNKPVERGRYMNQAELCNHTQVQQDGDILLGVRSNVGEETIRVFADQTRDRISISSNDEFILASRTK